MIRKNQTLQFMISNDVISLLPMIAMVGIITLIANHIDEGYENLVADFEMWLVVFTLYVGGSSQSYRQHDRYITFGFCRNRFYREQAMLCGIRAFIVGLICALFRFWNQGSLILYFLEEETKTSEIYHHVSFVEILLTNMEFFFLCYLILLLLSTVVLNYDLSAKAEDGKSPQLRQRIRISKDKRFWVFRNSMMKVAGLTGMVMMGEGFIFYQQVQMTEAFLVRLGCMFGFAVVSMMLMIVGKKRFVPKYI